ncbi:hypothetical protein AYI70_g7633 [Smittium culicis]|uniref:Uncharacterized protein n=1 Tax=Smittium culicis TaxID=133412 RepID=A0A1R1XJU8_9FUNG|nr:hypothetical protein AYI70_g7633 [Smittium culicis]
MVRTSILLASISALFSLALTAAVDFNHLQDYNNINAANCDSDCFDINENVNFKSDYDEYDILQENKKDSKPKDDESDENDKKNLATDAKRHAFLPANLPSLG